MKLPLRKLTWRRAALLYLIGVFVQAILLTLSFLVPAGARIHALAITSIVMWLVVIVGGALWLGERR